MAALKSQLCLNITLLFLLFVRVYPIRFTNFASPPENNKYNYNVEADMDDQFDVFGVSPSNYHHNVNVVPNYHEASVVVAADGTGSFKKIMDAIAVAPSTGTKGFVIHIKKGIYQEYVTVDKPNIFLVGEGLDVTTITGNRDRVSGYDKERSVINAPNFIAMNLTIENTSPMEGGQAVALSISSDQSVIYNCAIRSNQDTLYAVSGRQFYKKCTIVGTVDFIFGYATAFFQNCQIETRTRSATVITANGRGSADDKSGFVFQFCRIYGNPDLTRSWPTFLGRPWGSYSRMVIMQSYMDKYINGSGWESFGPEPVPPHSENLFIAEYKNDGPGADVAHRIQWPGYHVLRSDKEAEDFTVDRFIDGKSWLPATRIPHFGGLKRE
ncbi:probable pectinesterase/pectinesterase inhibitor 32 [Rutidosis leptorrhynchoides]|uniref:probable pectinesterase/pectinesterase inhibitor 32 n=1 Tax=Rutidosis leptorrhynchoides TaxID=125765 RepID=UPI003A99889E